MSKKSKTKTEPWEEAKAPILGAGGSLTDAYNLNAPTIQNATNQLTGLLPGLVQDAQNGNPGVNAAQDYNVNVLGGQYLDQGNPYMQQMLDRTNNEVVNNTQASLGRHGLTGGSTYADLISKNVADNTSSLLYGDYNNERSRMATAAGQSPGLASADYLSIMPALAVADSAMNPLQAAGQYAGSLGGLFGGYGTTTQRKSPWEYFSQAAGNAAAAYGAG